MAERFPQIPPERSPLAGVRHALFSFDWRDAGTGAGELVAVMLLAGGALVATRHASRPAAASDTK
jgi:hypothetical protein